MSQEPLPVYKAWKKGKSPIWSQVGPERAWGVWHFDGDKLHLRELKRVTGPEETSEPAKEKNRKNETTQTPDHHQNQNYSTYDTHPVLASSPLEYLNFPPAVPVIGSRRAA